jgi:LPXTG-site transpeptidase (sortase) family protein
MMHPRTSTLAPAFIGATLLAVVLGVAGCSPAPGTDPAPTAAPASTTAAPVQDAGQPTRVEIPAIDVDENLKPVGLNPDGSMYIPGFGDAGWYKRGPRPGAAGPAVLVAHVHGPGGPDVFWRLKELEPGDRVTVHRTDGTSTFVVDGSERVAKEELPYDRIWPETDDAVLRLITCGGEFDKKIGGYPDNTIVYAHLV